MKWFNYLACFFAGVFLTNWIPHFVAGVNGERYPNPFATAPGNGLDSPIVNVLWALLNLVVGYCLLRAGKISADNKLTLGLFFLGCTALSLFLATMAPSVLAPYRH